MVLSPPQPTQPLKTKPKKTIASPLGKAIVFFGYPSTNEVTLLATGGGFLLVSSHQPFKLPYWQRSGNYRNLPINHSSYPIGNRIGSSANFVRLPPSHQPFKLPYWQLLVSPPRSGDSIHFPSTIQVTLLATCESPIVPVFGSWLPINHSSYPIGNLKRSSCLAC